MLKSWKSPNGKWIEFSPGPQAYTVDENEENVIHVKPPVGNSSSTLQGLQLGTPDP